MRSYLNDFNDLSGAKAEIDRRVALDDLNAEMSGISNGRMTRFLTGDHETRPNAARGKARRSNPAMSALDIMLATSPDYFAAHRAANQSLRDAQAQANALQARIERALEQEHEKLDALRGEAVTLPDGRKAFLDANGEAWTEDGEQLDAATTEGIDWTGRPTREDFLHQSERIAILEQAQTDTRILETRLGDIDNILNDPDGPPSMEDIEGLQGEIEGITSDLDAVQASTFPHANVSVSRDSEFDVSASAVPVL